jgi:hypothetical protein
MGKIRVAALYVQTGGCYFGIPDVDPWDEPRDARLYAGPWPVVAHPPCERWGRYWSGGPSHGGKKLGDDKGCFGRALAAVRAFGGVLEHPEASHAFRHFGLAIPMWRKGWEPALDGIGYVCCVAQGNYGHRARKLTWLYASVRREVLPSLDWSIPAPRERLDCGLHTAEERRAASPERRRLSRLTKGERIGTPPAFRDVLLTIARNARGQ